LYAIGEIFLVMVGILLALAISNWNENRIAKKDEIYVLSEVLKNLREDVILIEDIIRKRIKARNSVEELIAYTTRDTTNADSLKYHLADFLNFERYYPINNAYEILKSKGLKLSNNELTTKISRYYDYEQNKANSSIKDIEQSILRIFNSPDGLFKYINIIKLNQFVLIKDPDDPNFLAELNVEIIGFRDNNIGTLEKLLVFEGINKRLIMDLESELSVLK
jgi:hypothetical protein